MNVASLELCQELYKLSGWADTQNFWKQLAKLDATGWQDWRVVDFNGATIPEAFAERTYPAYDLGFLLRRLPHKQVKLRNGQFGWGVQYRNSGHVGEDYLFYDQQPENAVAKLLIELLKKKVVTADV